MTVARNAGDVLSDHTVFEVESIDRMYCKSCQPDTVSPTVFMHVVLITRSPRGVPSTDAAPSMVVTRSACGGMLSETQAFDRLPCDIGDQLKVLVEG